MHGDVWYVHVRYPDTTTATGGSPMNVIIMLHGAVRYAMLYDTCSTSRSSPKGTSDSGSSSSRPAVQCQCGTVALRWKCFCWLAIHALYSRAQNHNDHTHQVNLIRQGPLGQRFIILVFILVTGKAAQRSIGVHKYGCTPILCCAAGCACIHTYRCTLINIVPYLKLNGR
jgi:hypothetical protein